jgi:hypothetical protein
MKVKLFKSKNIYLLFLLPLLLAMQCGEDDEYSGFETSYYIENNASITLLYITDFDQIIKIEPQTIQLIGSSLNSETNPIPPTQSLLLSDIKLYKDERGSFILVYEQDPLNDSDWQFSEPIENRFDYKLVIKDELLN